MVDTIRGIYERYGFEPLETPAVEYVEVLGKFLPESQTPEGACSRGATKTEIGSRSATT